MARHAAAGTPEEIVAALVTWRDAGLDEIALAGLTDADAVAATLRVAAGAGGTAR